MALYEKIADELETRIARGIYKPGERIPSIRRLASDFGCNKLTVQKAFEKLKQMGILENTVGKGTFVRYPERIQHASELFDFRTDYLSESFFPHRLAQKIFQDLFEAEQGRAFSQPPVEGDPGLLDILGSYYQVPRKRMLILSGAQQGLDLTAKVFAAPISDAILFEDPTYPGAISLFKARHFVPLDADGANLSAMAQKLSPAIRLFYAMPSVHNPTGISYSTKKKEAVAKFAKQHAFYIIEDDYLSEFLETPSPRFIDILPEQTIYIKSLSQATVSGLRLGFMVLPEPLFEKFRYAKYTSDLASTGLMQKFAQIFIRSGGYRRHINAAAQRLHIRRSRLLSLISRCPDLSVNQPQSGVSLWIRSRRVPNIAPSLWTGGEEFSFSPDYRHCFRLSFMNIEDDRFDSALHHLEHVFKRAGFYGTLGNRDG